MTRRLVCGLLFFLSTGIARAGWTPLTPIAERGTSFSLLTAVSASGSVFVTSNSYRDKAYILRERWSELPELSDVPGSTIAAAFQDERPIVLLSGADPESNYAPRLSLARVRGGSWQVSKPVMQFKDGYSEIAWASLIQQGAFSTISVLQYWLAACGGGEASVLHSRECQWDECGERYRLTPPFRGDPTWPEGPTVESVGAGMTPEGVPAVFFQAEGQPRVVQVKLPRGNGASPLPADFNGIFTPLQVVSGPPLTVLGVQYIDYEPTGVLTAQRRRGTRDWSVIRHAFDRAGYAGFSACRARGNLWAVWDEYGGENTGLFYASLRGGVWSKERLVPGSAYCGLYFECKGQRDYVRALTVACTDRELHVIWESERLGLVHTSLAALALDTAEQQGAELLVHGTGFSDGAQATLNGSSVRIVSLAGRYLRLTGAPNEWRGQLRVRNPNGEEAVLVLGSTTSSGSWRLPAILGIALVLARFAALALRHKQPARAA